MWQGFSSIGLPFPLFTYQVICGYLRGRPRMSFSFHGTKKAEALLSENGRLFLAQHPWQQALSSASLCHSSSAREHLSGRAGPRGRRPGFAEREQQADQRPTAGPTRAPWTPRAAGFAGAPRPPAPGAPQGQGGPMAWNKSDPRQKLLLFRRHRRLRAWVASRAAGAAGRRARSATAGLGGGHADLTRTLHRSHRRRLSTVRTRSRSPSPARGGARAAGRLWGWARRVRRPRAPSPRRPPWPGAEAWGWGCWPSSQVGKLRLRGLPALPARPARRCGQWRFL